MSNIKLFESKGITVEEEINESLLASYNAQLEIAVEKNEEINIAKAGHYTRTFRAVLACVIPCLVCTAYYLDNSSNEVPSFELKNYRVIRKSFDSIQLPGLL